MTYLFLLLELEIAGEGVEDVPRGLGAMPRFFSVYENGVPTLNPHMAHGGLGEKKTRQRGKLRSDSALDSILIRKLRSDTLGHGELQGKKEAFTNMAF